MEEPSVSAVLFCDMRNGPVDLRRCGGCLFSGFAQTSRPASVRARFSAREGIGGSITKSCVQTKSAADPRPSRRPNGRRRPTRGYVRASNPHFCRIEEAGDHWSPLRGKGGQAVKESVFSDDLYDMIFAHRFHPDFVGATTGRPLFIYCKDKIKAYPILSASLAHCRIFSQNVCMKKTAFHTERPFRYRGRILYRTNQNVRRSRIYAATSLMGRRTCSMVSRSRMVTQPSCSESKS